MLFSMKIFSFRSSFGVKKKGLVCQESKDYFLLRLPIIFLFEILHSWTFPDGERVTIQFPEQKACVDLVSKWSD